MNDTPYGSWSMNHRRVAECMMDAFIQGTIITKDSRAGGAHFQIMLQDSAFLIRKARRLQSNQMFCPRGARHHQYVSIHMRLLFACLSSRLLLDLNHP